MFNESNYDITEFSMAPNGMNQFVSPDILPRNFCYSLENIIPSPLGTGQVRYGTSLINSLSNPEFNIIRAFPFTVNGNIKQAILYVGYYYQDTATSINLTDASHLSFNSIIPTSYIPDTKIKIVYTFNGQSYTLYSDLKGASAIGAIVTIILENNLLPDPTSGTLVISQIWCQFGAIYDYNYNTNTLSTSHANGLSISCVPRASYFQQKMLICNGVDNVMYWDGENLDDVSEFLIETQVNTFIRINNTHFSFVKFGTFDISKYFIGNSIQLTIDGVNTVLTISNTLVVANVVTVTTNENIPAFGTNITLYYQDKPPTFSYIYIANDRIWALGPGAVSLEYRNTNEQLRVYYSYRPNSVTGYGLFNENTKTVPSIPMFDKHNIQDNFEAICQINGFMVFIGRKHTQVWAGDTPGQGGNFSWSSNLQVGILHGDLLIELSNDAYFVSQSGIHSFSTLNVAKQFSATSDDSVDSIVKVFTSDATASNANYRKCISFKYNEGGFAGFKISNNKILASLFSTKLYSWFYLSGDFRISNCFMDIGQQFYLFIDNKIFKYADGNDGAAKIYGDQGGQSFIPISWIPGLIKFNSRRGYANKRYEIVLNYPSSFMLNENNLIEISIFGDTPKSFSLTDKCEFEYRGDLIGQEPLTVLSESEPNDPGFRLRKEYEIVNKRLKFLASSFWISVSGYVMNGPVIFRRIRLFGIGERNA